MGPMLTARGAAVLLALCAAGCAESHAAPDGAFARDAGLDGRVPVDAPLARDGDAGATVEDWERWVVRYERAVCATQVRCASAGAQPRSLGSCAPVAIATRDALAPSIADGRVRFDPDAAAACLDALSTLSCGAWSPWAVLWEPALEVCARVFDPRVPEGGACRPSRLLEPPWHECAGDAYCDEGTECGATCRPRPGPGEPCASELPIRSCADGWRCDGGTCGASCEDDADCRSAGAPSRICERGGCVDPPIPGAGEPCGRVPCDARLGLACEEGVCAPSGLAEGEDCTAATCRHPLRCEGGRCAVLGALGETCDELGDACADGLHCTDPDGAGSRCSASREGAPCAFSPVHRWDPCAPDGMRCVGSPQRCRRPSAPLAPCADDRECGEWLLCVAGRCVRTPLEGEACGVEAPCFPSHVCEGGRCESRPRIGEACDPTRPCIEGSCEDGTCRWRDVGATCADAEVRECAVSCLGDRCAAHAIEGERCVVARDCAAGLDCRPYPSSTGDRRCQPRCDD